MPKLKLEKFNKFGDPICPKCKTNIVTPFGAFLTAGTLICPVCSCVSELTEEVVSKQNKLEAF